MGQRLNMEIQVNGEAIANVYYHWSAYTGCTANILQAILTSEEMNKDYPNLLAKAVALLTLDEEGIPVDERSMAKELVDSGKLPAIDVDVIRPSIDRNCGLLAITPKGIEETRDWAEGTVVIDLAKRTVNFGVVWYQDELEYDEDWNPFDTEDITMLPYDVSDMTFEDAINFCETINATDTFQVYEDISGSKFIRIE